MKIVFLFQGQTQTVLVAQTAQQQGTGTKTIIILQPQAAQAPPPQQPPPSQSQKMIVQRLQSPPPPPLMAVPAPSPSPSATQNLTAKQQQTPIKVVRSIGPPTSTQQQTPVIVSTAILTQQTPTHVVHGSHNYISTQNTSITHSPITAVSSAPSHIQQGQTVVVSQHHPAALTHHGTAVVTSTVNCSTQLSSAMPSVSPATIISSSHQIVSSNNLTNVIATNTGQPFKTTVVSRTNVPVVRPTAMANVNVNTSNTNNVNNNNISSNSSNSSSNLGSVSQVSHSVSQSHLVTATSTITTTSLTTSTSFTTTGTSLASIQHRTASPVVSSVASTGTITSSTGTSTTPTVQQGHFLCEWRGCMR